MRQTNEKASKKLELYRICEGYTILAVYLFGSMANEGVALLDNKLSVNLDPLADLDVGVVFLQAVSDPKERVKLYKKLYSDLSDLFSPLSLDLVFLQETGVIFQSEAITAVMMIREQITKKESSSFIRTGNLSMTNIRMKYWKRSDHDFKCLNDNRQD